MLNHALRYLPVVDMLSGRPPRELLEVGCGPTGIAEFTDRPFVGCDIGFPPEAPPRMRRVVSTAAALPFLDGAFDTVIALDLIEHVDPGERSGVIGELLRVSRERLIVAAPCGRISLALERALDRWYRILGIPSPPWLREHLEKGLPEAGEIGAALEGADRTLERGGNENAFGHLGVMALEALPPARELLDRAAARRPGLVRRLIRLTHLPPFYRRVFVVLKKHPGGG